MSTLSEPHPSPAATLAESTPQSRTKTAPAPLRRRRPPLAILGVPFDNVTKTEALERIELMIASRQPHYLVTPNLDFLVQARTDIELRRILLEAHLVVCDGTPLVWASRLLGNPLPERVAGADLVPLLIALAASRGYRLFLLGATAEASESAVRRLRAQHPSLVIAGSYSPPFNKLLEMDHAEIKRRISDARPDVLLVSLGCPKQEKWMAMHYRDLGVPVTAGVGATIDFLAGQVKRAPVWMQRSGTEWVYRMAQEPRRLVGRYARDLWGFGWSILPQWWHLQRRPAPRSRQTSLPENAWVADSENGFEVLRLPERLDYAAILGTADPLQSAPVNRHLLLDAAAVRFIDSTAIGWLIRLQKTARERSRRLVLVAPPPAVRRALVLMRLQEFFPTAADLTAAKDLVGTLAREESSAVGLDTTGSAPRLFWQGEITAANASQVREQTEQRLLSLPADQPWVIGLENLRFLDSSGLGVMVRLKRLAQARSRPLRFDGMRPAVRNVLRLARMEEFFQIDDSGPHSPGRTGTPLNGPPARGAAG